MSGMTRYLLIVQFLITTNNGNAKQMNFLSAGVTFNPEFLQDHRLEVHNGALDIILNIAQDIKSESWFKLQFLMKSKGFTGEYRTLLHYDMNLCQAMRKGSSKIFTSILDGVIKLGNLPRNCPFTKGNYSMHGFKVDMMSIPPIFGSAVYKIYTDSYIKERKGKVWLCNATIVLEIK